MNEKSDSPVMLPSFEPWENYKLDQLEAIVRGWRLILSHSSIGAMAQYGKNCIREIEAEIQSRE